MMPSWPTLYPLYLHYKTSLPVPWDNTETFGDVDRIAEMKLDRNVNINAVNSDFLYNRKFHLTSNKLQMLYECEEERHIYKACLREMVTLKKSDKHTSWTTADVSSLYLN